jgi:hypothetical protein
MIAACCVMAAPGTVCAAFKDAGWGVRPLGMGGAFTAVANDANAPLYNPAGLAQISQKEVTFMSSKLFTGLEGVDVGLNYLSYVHSSAGERGNFAVTWAALSSAALYREDTGSISYGRYIGGPNLSLGANLKFLRHEYSTDLRSVDDPVFADGTLKNAVTADVGLLVGVPDTGLTFGFTGKNITSPDVGLKTVDKLPMETVFGVAYYQDRMPYIALPACTVALDIVNRDQQVDYRLGAEAWFFDERFAIRAGGRAEEVTFGLGYEIKIVSDMKLIVDYALAWPLQVEETSGSHRIGLTIRLP